jgi:uncharacterized protein YggT (Ycf19 family)
MYGGICAPLLKLIRFIANQMTHNWMLAVTLTVAVVVLKIAESLLCMCMEYAQEDMCVCMLALTETL